MKRLMCVLWFILCVQVSFSALVVKKNLGLFGGHIENMVTFDMPGTQNRTYADVLGANALYFTDDNGLTWNLAIQNEDTYGLAGDTTYLYVAVNNMEIWRTAGIDGLSYTTILSPFTPVYLGEAFQSMQHDSTRLMVGCERGVAYFNATGNPADWTRHLIKAGASPDTTVMCLASRPSDPKTIFAVLNSRRDPEAATNELYVSTDSGLTWSAVSLPATITTAIEVIAEDPNNPNTIYMAGDSAQATIYKNSNYLDPATWTDITPVTFEHHYPQKIQFHNNLMWTTAHSYDNATHTWTPNPMTTANTHVNDGALAFDPDDVNLVFTASDVGVAVSTDGAITFEERNTGIEAVNVNDIDVDKFSKDVALVASKSGLAITSVFQKPPVPSDWNYPVFPSGMGGAPLSAACILIDSTQEMLVGDQNETIFKSDDGGLSWREVFRWLSSPIESRSRVNDIDHAVGSSIVYSAIGFDEGGTDGIVVRSDDRGSTWSITNLTGVHPNAIEVVGTHLVYAGVGHVRDIPTTHNIGLWVTSDGGGTWNPVLSPSGSLYNGIVTDIAQHPTTPQLQYFTIETGPDTGAVIEIEYDASGTTVVHERNLSLLYGGPTHGQFTAIETNDTGTDLYIGINEDIVLFDTTSNTWSLYHAGLRGERINRLYWDALVSGSSTGLYGYEDAGDAIELLADEFEWHRDPFIDAGEPLADSLILHIANIGTLDSGAFTVGIYLSVDRKITIEDVLLVSGRESVDGLAAGELYHVPLSSTLSIPADTPSGLYYLGVLVDELESVEEFDETNNTSIIQVMVNEETAIKEWAVY